MKPARVVYMDTKKFTPKALIYCVGIALVLGVVYLILVATGTIYLPGARYTEERMTLPNLSGMEFKIIYTTRARLFVTDYAINVYVRRAAVKEESLFARWSNRKTLLFRYDPENYDSPLPSIQAPGDDRILISIPRVSQVYFQSRKWGNVTIDYDIRKIDNP
jgi:hypothetical protein